MQIGKAAQTSGLSAKMIRHYEAIGLVRSADRRDSNYRDYSDDDVHQLSFIRRSRALGFSMDEIRSLLRLWADGNRSSREVKKLALIHIEDLNQRIKSMQDIRDTLSKLAHSCDGNNRPHCPIIDSLEGRL
jgi:Cu(I)-responsive transcriptional regulator